MSQDGWKRALRTTIKVLRWAVLAVGGFIAFSVLWVGFYRFVDPPTTYLMATTGLAGQKIQHRDVSLKKIAPAVWESVIASEDQRFCDHMGFDLKAIHQAVEEAEDGGRHRGASTISQQTAKNAFLWPGKNYVRKGLEAYFTVLIETVWPKRRIMEVYLNITEFGPGIFGAEAAAERYFSKPARDLDAREAALLASVLPNPKRLKAGSPGPYSEERATHVEALAQTMRDQGMTRCVVR